MIRWLGIAAAIALVVMYAAWSVQVSNIRADAASAATAAEKVYSDLKGMFDAYKLQVEQGISDQATIRANENLAALDRERALQAEADRLRIQASTATRQRNEASQKLLEALSHAPQTDVSPLDTGSREFFARLRGQQLAPTTTSDQATRGSPP
jgi:hypothetical protein